MTNRFPHPLRMISSIVGKAAIPLTAIASFTILNLWASPSLARDVFRTSKTHKIGDNTEAAFNAIFKNGNYPEAKRYLQQAESTQSNEPLDYAMLASFAYNNQDWNALKIYANKTLQSAQELNRNDPLRGQIYIAVGNALAGAYTFKQQGPVGALAQLQEVFQHLDEAKKIAPNDPELNLLQGYMSLLLATSLPFSDTNQAIEQLANYAGPRYLADRGIAIGYRDLQQYDKALEYVNRAMQQTLNNPEIHYLKAQILVGRGNKQRNSSSFQQAKQDFQAALSKPEQLPKAVVAQIFYEECNNQNHLDNKGRDCNVLQNQIKKGTDLWGPVKLPQMD
ncbi:MAG: Sll0314/Alr1548 family TPR repeat-containing protein [Chamaesiphon sp.]